MTPQDIRERIPETEFEYFSSRSSGPGGQNVNKLSTKIEVHFNVRSSYLLSEREKEIIQVKLRSRISSSGELITRSQSERSQIRNKEKAVAKMYELLAAALTEKPARKPTFPHLKSKEARIEAKRKRGSVKKLRKTGGISIDENL